MSIKKHRPEQIIRKLREADVELSRGQTVGVTRPLKGIRDGGPDVSGRFEAEPWPAEVAGERHAAPADFAQAVRRVRNLEAGQSPPVRIEDDHDVAGRGEVEPHDDIVGAEIVVLALHGDVSRQ